MTSDRITRALTTAITSAAELVWHEIAEEDLHAGSTTGTYRTLCGELILPAALGETARTVCAGCAATRLHPELSPGQDCSRAARRGIAGALRECVAIARCALQTSAAAA